jgi:steroid delta-isomerase-like uncharacterized protein
MKTTLKTVLTILVMSFFVSAAYCQDSPEQTNQKIKDMYEKINAKDISGAMQNLDINIVDHIPFIPDQKPGVDGFKQVFNALFKAFPDFHQEINDLIISPDGKKASVLVTITGTNKGDFMGMPATNKKINILGIDNMHLESGKFTDHWGFVDSQAMMQQLGMMK